MCENRRDSDPFHLRAFREAVDSATIEKFDPIYGRNQIHLKILGTHPAYHKMGAASTLLRWGVKQAQDQHLPVILFAGPMAQPLYASFGFEARGTVNIQVLGEEEFVSLEAMALEPKDR